MLFEALNIWNANSSIEWGRQKPGFVFGLLVEGSFQLSATYVAGRGTVCSDRGGGGCPGLGWEYLARRYDGQDPVPALSSLDLEKTGRWVGQNKSCSTVGGEASSASDSVMGFGSGGVV